MAKVKVCVLRAAGTNCDQETAFAFSKAGAEAELVHINRIVNGEIKINLYQILAIPGGFTYGDDIAAGRVLANELRTGLADGLKRFIREGKLIIGICNGFQILVKAGLLPGNDDFKQEASLTINDSGKFEDRWVNLRTTSDERRATICAWTKNLPPIIYLPVAHGEGKFVADKTALRRLKRSGQIVFQYCNKEGKDAGYPDNPNGSMENIAGICDEAGRVLGLMPHPERHISVSQHPRWGKLTTNDQRPTTNKGDGLQILENGVNYAKKNL
jgi:phosphoribosylformylglycinamidine synthase